MSENDLGVVEQKAGCRQIFGTILMVLSVITMLVSGICTIGFSINDPEGILIYAAIGGGPFLLAVACYLLGNWLRKHP